MKKKEGPHNDTIMVVDDNPVNVDLLKKMLCKRGYNVRAFTNSQFALESARFNLPDLILLDIKMPGIDGVTFCRKLKEKPEIFDVPVIFISALQETENKLAAFDAGGVDYITKPFQEAEVMVRVKTHLELRNMKMHLEDLVSERTAELQDAYDTIRERESKYKSLFNDALDMIHHR